VLAWFAILYLGNNTFFAITDTPYLPSSVKTGMSSPGGLVIGQTDSAQRQQSGKVSTGRKLGEAAGPQTLQIKS
jgi:hypothetical protein